MVVYYFNADSIAQRRTAAMLLRVDYWRNQRIWPRRTSVGEEHAAALAS